MIASLALAPLAHADTAPPAGTPETVTADNLPTWQTNGIVWSLTQSGGTVYAGGNFDHIRPPGTADGDPSQLTRSNLAAFNVATGQPTGFDHAVTGTAYSSTTNPGPECDSVGTNEWLCQAIFRVKAAPDGSALYFGGDFTHVDGEPRSRLAGVSLSTGQLDPAMTPDINGRVRGIAVSATTVYIGGDFTQVDGQTRTRLAALDRATGALLPWAPAADDTVRTLALSSDGSRVIVGGDFPHLNGSNENAIGAVDASTGALTTWNSRPIQSPNGSQFSGVTELVVVGPTVFGGAHGEGGGVFDGRFAVDTNTGTTQWKDTCLGATTTIAVQGGIVYSGSHAHDCSSMGGWSQTNPATYQRLLAETADSGGASKNKLLHWFPSVNTGPADSYYKQGPWAMANDDTYLWVAGEFTKVGGVDQQGLTRFAPKSVAPDINPPEAPFAAPVATNASKTSLKVSWDATWDRDNTATTYQLFRDDGTTPIYTTTVNTNFWTLPTLSFTDTGLVTGSSHYYRVKVADPFNNKRSSPYGDAVTVKCPWFICL
ncbi:hypothetical protein GCM10009765_42290 [Fodinicola feengrottensis]|uniref:Fibronectin type-III domain-containing protein n=1 Tax=Fodinicola feengrottensis TaxID=435914 RepID=A0ABP4TJG4_9ACTN